MSDLVSVSASGVSGMASGDKPRSTVARWLREPLLQFMAAGFVVFALYAALHGGPGRQEPRRIEITADDVKPIEIAWLARWQRLPTADELRSLIDEQVKEEILNREAIALGLEEGDTIIRRRLAQKMGIAVRGHGVQGREQICGRAQQRVRLREL